MLKKQKKFLLAILLACISLSVQNGFANKTSSSQDQDEVEFINETNNFLDTIKKYKEYINSFKRSFEGKNEKHDADKKMEKAVKKYIACVSQNPKLFIKYRPNIPFLAKFYKSDMSGFDGIREKGAQLRNGYNQCLRKNSKDDCNNVFSLLSKSFFDHWELKYI
ncbi:hypothetical protein KAH94_03300 [bacterium]|nr:hypothetical protein [bacterium]